jgi:hypothetical protein
VAVAWQGPGLGQPHLASCNQPQSRGSKVEI